MARPKDNTDLNFANRAGVPTEDEQLLNTSPPPDFTRSDPWRIHARHGHYSPLSMSMGVGHVGRHAHRTEKDYWAQAEGLLAALRLHRRTGDARYGRCYLRTLDWIVDAQADWVVGDWHERIDHRGRPGGVKSGMWKDPYHQGRALVECLELLRPAPSAPSSTPI